MQLAKEMAVPVLISEQYPQGLGHTVKTLAWNVDKDNVMTKVHFSCADDADCLKKINEQERHQIVIIGIETHVCVLQTAVQLQYLGKQVYVVGDAVGSRDESDYRFGLERMRSAGVQIVSKEMVFFEWLRQAGTARFKALSKQFFK